MDTQVQLVLEPQYAGHLYRSSWLTSLSVIWALTNHRWDCGIASLAVLITSINYWRYPVLGWRRNMDICVAFSGFLYQLVVVCPFAPGKAPVVYASTVLGCLGCYLRARHVGRVLRDPATSAWWHRCIHWMGNIGNCILYDSVGHNWLCAW